MISQKLHLVLLIGAFSISCVTLPVHADIPVIDTANINQQAKTLAETIKVVENTKEQIELQTEDLRQLPGNILNAYKESFSNGISKLKGILHSAGTILYFADTTDANVDAGKYFDANIPGIIGNDLPTTLQGARTARLMAINTLMHNNKDTVTAIQGLLGELNQINEEIKQAQEDSANATGSVQVTQAANHIAALQLRAQNIKIIIQGLQGQQAAFKNQADAQEKKNAMDVADAQTQAEEKATEDMLQNSSVYTTFYDPWKAHEGSLLF